MKRCHFCLADHRPGFRIYSSGRTSGLGFFDSELCLIRAEEKLFDVTPCVRNLIRRFNGRIDQNFWKARAQDENLQAA